MTRLTFNNATKNSSWCVYVRGGGGGAAWNNYCIATYISIPEGEAGSDINIDNLGQVRMVLVCGEAL